jgi:hypothetical protein
MARKRLRLPVVMSRWFADGHSYAYNAEVDRELLTTAVNTFGSMPPRTNASPPSFSLDLPDGRRLIAKEERDIVPLDPKAHHRPTFITRIAICPPWATKNDEESVRSQLANLQLPTEPGLATDLEVTILLLPAPPAVPLPDTGARTVARRLATGYSPWLIVMLLAILELGLQVFGVESEITATIARMLMLLSLAALLALIQKPWPKRNEIGKLEWLWYPSALPPLEFVGYVARGAKIIKPDGILIEVSGDLSIRELRVFRDPDDPVTYDPRIQVRPGMLVLSGEERIATASGWSDAAFVRAYSWHRRRWSFHGDWRLDYAQWTAVAPGSVATGSPDTTGQSGSDEPNSDPNEPLQQVRAN